MRINGKRHIDFNNFHLQQRQRDEIIINHCFYQRILNHVHFEFFMVYVSLFVNFDDLYWINDMVINYLVMECFSSLLNLVQVIISLVDVDHVPNSDHLVKHGIILIVHKVYRIVLEIQVCVVICTKHDVSFLIVLMFVILCIVEMHHLDTFLIILFSSLFLYCNFHWDWASW